MINKYKREDVGSKWTDRSWDRSEANADTVMRGEYPTHVNQIRKCLLQMSKNLVKRDDDKRIRNYAVKYGLNEDKILAMYK